MARTYASASAEDIPSWPARAPSALRRTVRKSAIACCVMASACVLLIGRTRSLSFRSWSTAATQARAMSCSAATRCAASAAAPATVARLSEIAGAV